MQEVTGDAVVDIDSDLRDPPEFVLDMFRLFLDGADVVHTKRLSHELMLVVSRVISSWHQHDYVEITKSVFST